MHVTVQLLNGFKKPLTYKIPESWHKKPMVHDIISVPLQRRTELAYITAVLPDSAAEKEHFVIRQALEQNALPEDTVYPIFIKYLSYYYCVEEFTFYKRLAQYLESSSQDVSEGLPVAIHAIDFIPQTADKRVSLTQTQKKIINEIYTLLESTHQDTSPEPIVLHGVTGSGKTEIYKEIIKKNISQGNNVLFLLPEVSLAVQFNHIFKDYLGDTAAVFGFHSATSKKEKMNLWKHLYTDKPALIIGVHLPILLPIARLGCIIIDEEHDTGYQEKKIPRIHIKEAALMRAHLGKIPIILGSATPSISTLYNVEHKGWKMLSLKERYKGAFPDINIVVLDKKNKNNFWISKELHQELAAALARKEQALIFLNRRGYSFFVQCFSCNYIFSCENCSVSLTLHEHNNLACHYCGNKKMVPPQCPECKQPEKQFLKKGIGTQQVVTLLQKLFPQARIARADLDSTINKKKWHTIIEDMHTGNLDILVGTQTITKGYHFPKVTLVGILWADSNIHFPFYAAAETTLSQLIQVAGRSGRESDHGKVIVQTLTQHPLFSFINESNYLDFYSYEKLYRQELEYPPYIRFAEIEFRHTDEKVVEEEALYCAKFIEENNNSLKDRIIILGPSKPIVHKIQNIYVQKIYLKSSSINTLIKAYHALSENSLKSSHFFTPNPLC